MATNYHARFWLIGGLLFVALLWLLQPVLLPFVAGITLAYFLAPLVTILEKKGIPRWFGALIVMSGFLVVGGLILTLILPMITNQVGALVSAVPAYIAKLRTTYMPWFENWVSQFQPEEVEKIKDAAGQSAADAAGWLGNLLKRVVTSGFALIDAVALTIITPVTAFFVLRDWPKLVSTIDSLFPRRYYGVIKGQLHEIDRTLSGFIRGQALVCLALGLVYSLGLTLVGLKYSAAIGVTAGVLSFIPYVGSLFGWVSSIILALVQFEGDWVHIGLVALVFLVGHFLEAYVLTPKLVGNRVGLHPVWILFALITGVKLMGFTGVLIAVPTAAVLGVLVRFMVREYKSSTVYKNNP